MFINLFIMIFYLLMYKDIYSNSVSFCFLLNVIVFFEEVGFLKEQFFRVKEEERLRQRVQVGVFIEIDEKIVIQKMLFFLLINQGYFYNVIWKKIKYFKLIGLYVLNYFQQLYDFRSYNLNLERKRSMKVICLFLFVG